MNSCVLSIFSLLLSEKEESSHKETETDPSKELNGSLFTDYVHAHYMENLQLKDVSSHFGFTSAYFSKLFYRETGRNFKYYLSSIRLGHASYLLERSSLSITKIAEESGFPNLRAFTDLFIKVNGMTPREYRASCKKTRTHLPHDEK
jgi:transcriptional regulator, araC family